MINNFKKGLNGDYGVKLTPNKPKVLCEVDWPAFGVGWSPEGSLDRTVINQSLSVLMDTFGVPVCTSSPKMGILKEE
jgi:hypothetical protein